MTESIRLPEGLKNAYGFSLFNSICFQIYLSTPMILFARSLGASATVIGILTGLTPLFTLLQIPGASLAERFGYKRLMCAGWVARTCFILVAVALPWLGGVWDNTTRTVVLLLSIAGFCLFRGITSSSWMPWLTALLPPDLRAYYMVREQTLMLLSGIGTFLLAGQMMGDKASPMDFSLIFFISFCGGMASVYFLKRIPDVPSEKTGGTASPYPVPWRAIWNYRPFQKLLYLNLAWIVVSSTTPIYSVVMLRESQCLTEGEIVNIMAAGFVGGITGLWTLGHVTDRFGSKPVMLIALFAQSALMAGWSLLGWRFLPFHYAIIATLVFFSGLAASCFGVAYMRRLMGVVPEKGRSHFFALLFGVSSLVMAGMPLLWGIGIDFASHLLESRERGVLSGCATLFCLSSFLSLMLPFYLHSMPEEKSRHFDELLREIFIAVPYRAFNRLLGH